jgi:hypothetical protein
MILEAFQRPMKGQLLRQGLSLDCGCFVFIDFQSQPKTGSVPDFGPKTGSVPDFGP